MNTGTKFIAGLAGVIAIFLVDRFFLHFSEEALRERSVVLCQSTAIGSQPGADDKLVAHLFVRDCAGLPLSVHVSLGDSKDAPSNQEGNVFVATGAKIVTTGGSMAVEGVTVAWDGATRLQVNYPASLVVLTREATLDGVTIAYSAVP